MILLAAKGDPVLPDADDGGDDTDAVTAAFEYLTLLDMRLEISDMPPGFSGRAQPAGETGIAQGVPHGSAAAAVTCGIDVGIGDGADVRPAAEEVAEMSFFVAPRRDFDGAAYAWVGIDDASGFEGINNAERPIEPACKILAFEMRPRQQFRPGFRTGSNHVADAIDRSGEARLGKPLREPLQRAHMRLGESRLVNAGLVGADAAKRIEIRKDPGPVDVRTIVRHEPTLEAEMFAAAGDLSATPRPAGNIRAIQAFDFHPPHLANRHACGDNPLAEASAHAGSRQNRRGSSSERSPMSLSSAKNYALRAARSQDEKEAIELLSKAIMELAASIENTDSKVKQLNKSKG